MQWLIEAASVVFGLAGLSLALLTWSVAAYYLATLLQTALGMLGHLLAAVIVYF